jgi:nicotinamidase-related amidase
VLKPKHSGFYHTTLPLLLEYLEVRKLIVTGIATDNCVLYTAADAYMSDLEVYVPADCCAAEDGRRHEAALEQMRNTLKADTTPSSELKIETLAGVARRGVEQSLR